MTPGDAPTSTFSPRGRDGFLKIARPTAASRPPTLARRGAFSTLIRDATRNSDPACKEKDDDPDQARRCRYCSARFRAQRDVQVVTQMERYGEAQSVPGEILYEAFLALTRARQACSEGRVAGGLALYDSIFKTSLAGQMQAR